MPGTGRAPVGGKDSDAPTGQTLAVRRRPAPVGPNRRAILPRVLLIAHRTPRTAAACDDLAAAGAQLFECDVQLRGDTVVVSHFLPFLGRPGWLEHDNA